MRQAYWFRPNRFSRTLLALVVGCGLIGLNPQRVATAAESETADALKLIPDEALGAVVLNRFDVINRAVIKVAMNLNWDLSAPHILAINLLHDRQGLNDKGVAVLVLLPPISDQSKFLFATLAVPVTDYEKYISNFATVEMEAGYSRVFALRGGKAPAKDEGASGLSIWAIKKGDYALLMFPYGVAGESDEAQQEMRKRVKKILVDRPAEMSAAIAGAKDWLTRQDIGAIVTTAGVKLGMETAHDGVRQVKATFDRIANRQFGDDEEQAAAMRRQMRVARQAFDLYDAMFAWIEKEASQFLAGVRIDDDGTIRVAGRTNFTAGSKWKELASKLPAPRGTPMSGLSGGPYIAAFEGAFSSGSSFMVDCSLQMLKMAAASSPESKLTDDDWKRLAEAMAKSMEGVRSMSMVLGVPKAGESLYGAMTGLIKVDDATKYLKNYAQSIAAFGEISAATKNSYLGKYDSKLTEVDGSPTLEVLMDYSEMITTIAKQPGSAGMKAYMEMLLGAEGKTSVFLQSLDQTTVVMAWSDKTNLERAKAAAKLPAAGLASDAGAKSTVALLPKGSQWTVLVNPPGAISFVQSLMQALGVPGMPALPNLGEVPPLGFAARLDGESLEMELVVTGATVEGVGKALQR